MQAQNMFLDSGFAPLARTRNDGNYIAVRLRIAADSVPSSR
jgi:hypothetical protein